MENKLAKTTGQRNLPSLLPQKLEIIINSTEVQLIEYVSGLTPQKAYGGQMSNFYKSNESDLYKAIEKLLASLALSLNVGKNLEDYQIPPLAREIYKKYYFYSLDEIALVFRKGAQGEYGKLYDKLDRATILDWFVQYDSRDRDAIVENQRQQDNNKLESESLNEIFSKLGGTAGINKLKEDLIDPKEAEYKAMKEEYFKSKQEKK